MQLVGSGELVLGLRMLMCESVSRRDSSSDPKLVIYPCYNGSFEQPSFLNNPRKKKYLCFVWMRNRLADVRIGNKKLLWGNLYYLLLLQRPTGLSITIELSDYWLPFTIDKVSVYMDYLPYKCQSQEFKMLWTIKKLQNNFLMHILLFVSILYLCACAFWKLKINC